MACQLTSGSNYQSIDQIVTIMGNKKIGKLTSANPNFFNDLFACPKIKEQGASSEIHKKMLSLLIASSSDPSHLKTYLLGLKILLKEDESKYKDILNRMLLDSVEKNLPALIPILLENGADINFSTMGRTPLHEAAKTGNIECINLLLKSGAEINAPDSKGKTALHISCDCGKYRAIQLLLENPKVDPFIKDNFQKTAFCYAAYQEDMESIKLFLNKDITFIKSDYNINEINKFGSTLLNSVINLDHCDDVDLLLSLGADPNIIDENERTALHYAAMQEKPQVVEKLLAYKADHNCSDKEGRTPLHHAVMQENPEVVKKLLMHKADHNCSDKEGKTPLHHAVIKANEEIVKILLSAEADPNLPDHKGKNPLHHAVIKGDIEIVKLLSAKANPNVPGRKGKTPLYYAMLSKKREIAMILLQNGADPNIYWRQLKVGEFANARGGRFASEPAQITIEKLETGRVGCKGAPLAKAKLQLSSGTSIYRTSAIPPLFLSLNDKDISLAEALLKHGADITILYQGMTIFETAVKSGALEFVYLILESGKLDTSKKMQELELLAEEISKDQTIKHSKEQILQLLIEINYSPFHGIDISSQEFKALIQKYDSEKILKTIYNLIEEIGADRLSRYTIIRPFELLQNELKYGHPFLGQPYVSKLKDKKGSYFPKFEWRDPLLYQDSLASDSFFQSKNKVTCSNAQIKKTLDHLPKKREFQSLEELEYVLAKFKKHIPSKHKLDGCAIRARWSVNQSKKTMNYKAKKIVVYPANNKQPLVLKAPLPTTMPWICHLAAVVSLNQEEWVIDTALENPIRLNDWLEALGGEKMIKVTFESTNRISFPEISKLRMHYLLEYFYDELPNNKTYEDIYQTWELDK